jgi:glycosyltransferase involved in cell wall biosynthesis
MPEQSPEETKAPLPVTVVVPVHREGADVTTTLEAALRQHPAAVHVVETAEDAATTMAIEAIAAAHPTVRVFSAPGATPGVTRNVGTEAATTEWVAYLDAGTVPDPGWLQTSLSAVTKAAGDAAFPFVTADVLRPIARWYALAYLPPVRPAGDGVMRRHHVPGMLVRRQVWETVGGFPDLRAAEDNVFVARLASRSVVDVPAARITWSGPDSWRTVWRRTVLYAAATLRGGQADWSGGFWRWWAVIVIGVAAFGRRGALIVLLLQTFRAALRVERHHRDPDLGQRQVWDVAGTTIALCVIDLAMLVGVIRAVAGPKALATDWTDAGSIAPGPGRG